MNGTGRTKWSGYVATLASVALVAGLTQPAIASPRVPAPSGSSYVASEVLIRFESSGSAQGATIPSSIGRSLSGRGTDGVHRVALAPGLSVEEAVAELSDNPNVAYAEPNHLYSTQATTPNDPSFQNQWGLARIAAPKAWDLERGSRDVIIGVVDTGVEMRHPALQANMWENVGEIARNGIDDDRNGYIDDRYGWDVAGRDNDPTDTQGHGTHVAGIAAARGNDGIGTSGTAWQASIMPVRALNDDGVGTTLDIAQSIDYAVKNGAKVVNLSLGGDAYSQTLATSINNASGTLFVVAAGNGGSDGFGDDTSTQPSFPCDLPSSNIICVAATDSSDSLTTFSNYGASVDLAAPGRSILSTFLGGKYTYASGTSMATPFVAGAAALIWSATPTLTVSQVRSAILDGVEKVPSLEGKLATGGRLHLPGALGMSASSNPNQEPQPKPEPSPSPTPLIDPDPLVGGDPSPQPQPDEDSGTKSELTFSVAKRSAVVKVLGFLEPGARGTVTVKLARKRDGNFRVISKKLPTLEQISDELSSFRTRFERPKKGHCRITASFTDNGTTTTARRLFDC